MSCVLEDNSECVGALSGEREGQEEEKLWTGKEC